MLQGEEKHCNMTVGKYTCAPSLKVVAEYGKDDSTENSFFVISGVAEQTIQQLHNIERRRSVDLIG